MKLNTDELSARYRAAAIDLVSRQLLIINFHGTEQEQDLSEPANCAGFGRIRHFQRSTGENWPDNPLPIDPACQSLRLPPTDMIHAQVFQNAICNWRCWYCFVPFNLLSANHNHANWLSPARLIDLYLDQPNLPPMIDLTGGQPDLTPEWVPWMMAELEARGLEHTVYLWSDDNLSNDYFWRFLSDVDRERIEAYPNYGRVCCFKGFDATSFAFNTNAAPELFDQQFTLFRRLLTVDMDLYAYATFTTPNSNGLEDAMRQFVDRLQSIDEYLPLRTVPLKVQVFTPVKHRLKDAMNAALQNQQHAIEIWCHELEERYSSTERAWNIAHVPLCGRNCTHSFTTVQKI